MVADVCSGVTGLPGAFTCIQYNFFKNNVVIVLIGSVFFEINDLYSPEYFKKPQWALQHSLSLVSTVFTLSIHARKK